MARIVALLTILCFGSSCATLFAGNTRVITVTSSPPGAQISLNGQAAGLTPTRVTVNDHEKLVISVRKEGFYPSGCYMNTSVQPLWLVLDILLIFAIAPLIVDLVTDNWSSLEGEFCTLLLVPQPPNAGPRAYAPR